MTKLSVCGQKTVLKWLIQELHIHALVEVTLLLVKAGSNHNATSVSVNRLSETTKAFFSQT